MSDDNQKRDEVLKRLLETPPQPKTPKVEQSPGDKRRGSEDQAAKG